MLKRIARLALALSLLTPAVAFAQLERPQPAARSGALIGDTYTFSWGRVSTATWYEIWITDAADVVHRRWITASNAGCASAQSTTVCSMTYDWPLVTGNGEWWVQAWTEPNTYSGWGSGQRFNVVGRVPMAATGSTLTALGRFALQATRANTPSNTYGEHVAIGDSALQSFDAGLTSSFGQTSLGHTALGSRTLRSLVTTGSPVYFNTAVGVRALENLTGGSYNTAVGWSAGNNLSSGSHNVYIASPGGAANESNTLRLGDFYQDRAFITGVSGVTSASGAAVYVNSSGQLGTVTSSVRFKKNVRPIDRASERLFALKPVAFEYKPEIDAEGLTQFGLLAEDVERSFPELLVKDAAGKPQTVRYHLLVPLLLNETQKQQALISTLSAQTKDQEARLGRQDQRLIEQERRLNDLSSQIEALVKILQSR